MRALVLLAAGAAAAATADQCSVVTQRAPCGQKADSESTCLLKGCCYDGTDKVNPCFYPGYNAVPIKTVHVVQSNHFDAGFADSTLNILTKWFKQFFPLAYSLGLQLDALGGAPRLRWMAQSWIVSLYVDCPPNAGLPCPTAAELANFTDAVKRGYITWHAWPHNAELELCDESMVAYGFNLTHGLDAAYGLPPKATLSQRDVPGTTRAAIPLLKAAGVNAVSVGVNGASTPPTVPRAFVWRDDESGESVLAMWHPGGYGGIAYEDAVIVPGLSHALVMDWRGDNAGPPTSVKEVQSDWVSIGALFPGAQVVASTFDNFTAQLATVADQLPVVTSEIADTWMHGAGSDPQKAAWFRRAQAVRTVCLGSGACAPTDYAVWNMSRFLLKNSEHTWGKDVKTWFSPYNSKHWTNAELAADLAANISQYNTMIASWVEQRAWGFDYAWQALLAGSPLLAAMQDAVASAYPPPAPPSGNPGNGFTPLAPGTPVTAGRFTVATDPATGGIGRLVDAATGQTWADAASGHALAFLEYHTYTQDDFTDFINSYAYIQPPPSWFLLDFGKPNMSSANPVHMEAPTTLLGSWVRTDAAAGVVSLLSQAQVGPDATLHTYYGAPAVVWTQVDVPLSGASGVINVTIAMYDKTATRLPEAAFVRFPAVTAYGSSGASGDAAPVYSWRAGKLTSLVDPADVVPCGNRHLHGVNTGFGVTVADPSGAKPNVTMWVASPDASVSAWGSPLTALPTPSNATTTDLSGGGSFMLWNNLWGTNYPAFLPWKDTDANQVWRFSLSF